MLLYPPHLCETVDRAMSATSSNIDAIAQSLTAGQRTLVTRYLRNAISNVSRRTIRATNRHFAALLAESNALRLFEEAGFIAVREAPPDVSDACGDQPAASDISHYVLTEQSAASAVHRVIACLESTSSPSLLALPDELLMKVLNRLDAADLSVLQRVATDAVRLSSASALWLRHCPPRFWKEAKGGDRFGLEGWASAAPIQGVGTRRHASGSSSSSGGGSGSGGGSVCSAAPRRLPREFLDSIMWQHVHRLSVVWERLRARSSRVVQVSLREGMSLEALCRVPAAFRDRLPHNLVASLLVHDGQEEDAGSLGLLFSRRARRSSLRACVKTRCAARSRRT